MSNRMFIPLNIAQGNGKATDVAWRRFFEMARGSALEWGAVQDVLEVCGRRHVARGERWGQHKLPDRIVAMLKRLGQRGYTVGEQPAENGIGRIDTDTDSDPDADKP
jgi:hypothetical protein